MNILAIQILPEHDSIVIFEDGKKDKKYPAVKLTISNWIFWTKIVNAYPVEDTFYNNVDYVNDLGKEYNNDVNEQIINFVKLKHIQEIL